MQRAHPLTQQQVHDIKHAASQGSLARFAQIIANLGISVNKTLIDAAVKQVNQSVSRSYFKPLADCADDLKKEIEHHQSRNNSTAFDSDASIQTAVHPHAAHSEALISMASTVMVGARNSSGALLNALSSIILTSQQSNGASAHQQQRTVG